ncbi:MAG TPA: serine/threonine-protein kinase [Burkholderiaceae bacterium]|nr:serine/threonine-protein kinase [Burkholderiaceae bacterium]
MASLKVPERLGKYPITGVVGRGAMGIVFKGHDPVIKRPVAIKTIRKELLEDDDPSLQVSGASGQYASDTMSSRFQREAQAAGALNHPGIVSVYEYGEDTHYAFIAMEFVEGNNLRDYIANGTEFDEQDTVSIMAQLLDALHYAHGATVWHRDIKPANIIVMSNGRIKLTDFGIARLENADRTRTNVIMGTPGYIAPELYLGGQVDHRLDIFAAGVLFYQLLARKSPFRGGPEAIMHDVCYHDPEPASKADPQHRWPHYDAIVSRAIAKSPADRFQSAAEFRTAILDAYAQPVANTISEATIVTHRSRATSGEAAGNISAPPSLPKTFSVSSPSAPPPTGWSGVVLSGVEIEIAKYVGPVAKVLVRRAAKEHKDLESLVGALMPAIDDPKERSAFAKAVLGKPMTTPLRGAPRSSDGTALTGLTAITSGTRPGDVLTQAELERATKLLIGYIGPIGKVVAKRAASEGVSRRDFFTKVADALDNDATRERFMREAGFVEA